MNPGLYINTLSYFTSHSKIKRPQLLLAKNTLPLYINVCLHQTMILNYVNHTIIRSLF